MKGTNGSFRGTKCKICAFLLINASKNVIMKKTYRRDKMNIAICDDEPVLHKELKDALCMYGRDKNIPHLYTTCFTSGKELLESNEIFDIIFMDYQMKDMDGIETSEILRKNNDDTTIIFLSSYTSVVYDTFSVGAFRFLVKPLDMEKLYKALDDYRKSKENEKKLVIPTKDKTWNIPHSEIIYAEARKKHTLIRTTKNSYEVSKCIGEFEKLLTDTKFFRVHKSFIVNFDHISSYDKENIIFDNGEKAELSRNNYNDFRTNFLKFIMDSNLKRG